MCMFKEARYDFDVGLWLFGLSKTKAEAEISFMVNSKSEAGFQCALT